MAFKYDINDVVILKKVHPCGSNKWRIIRTGVDIKIECLECKRIVMLDRITFNKKIKKVVENE